MRHIEIEGSWNVRDLGGYPTSHGKTTRWRSLLRAGNLDKVSPAGQAALVDYGIRTIIDLRDQTEVTDFPDVFAQSTLVNYQHVPIARDGYTAAYVTLRELYCNYFDGYQANIGMIIGAIAESEPGVLFHCFAGKDRTGIVAALLLGAVGVPDEVIAEDYALTSGRITHLHDAWRAWAIQQKQDMSRFEHDVSSETETMLTTLEHIHRQYGGVASYLRTCGVTEQHLSHLQELLLE
ncbi:MAG: tyrosine-protein phosphatase [Chloroflexota bacterium]